MDIRAEVADLVASLKAEIVALRAEVAEPRRRLGLDSSNSSKPPSSDGLKKEPRIKGSLRGRSGKRSGGQTGHDGGTLRQVANPDAVVRHEACVCGRCGSSLDAKAATGIEKRQVFDIPERPLVVIEHQATIYRCTRCRGVTKAAFPEGVVSPTQYGERIRAAAIYLNVQQLIPEDRVAQALSDLFAAAAICPASIVAWVGKKARELGEVYQTIGQRVAEAGIRHLDETEYRIAGKLHWLHTTSSLAFTFYRAGEKRGDIPRDLQGGVVVHDHFLPYRGMDGVDHAFCNAHILRELQALIEFDEEPWAEQMRDMLLSAKAAVDEAREAGKTALPPKTLAAFVERYWQAVRLGLSFHRQLPKLEKKAGARGRAKKREGHNLLERLKTFKAETLRFMTDFNVPFTNNLAEQDLRACEEMSRGILKCSTTPLSSRSGANSEPLNARFLPNSIFLHTNLQQRRQLGHFFTGSQDDEGENENLRLVPNPRRRSNLRKPQARRLDRAKTGLQHAANPHRSPKSDHARLDRVTRRLGSYLLD